LNDLKNKNYIMNKRRMGRMNTWKRKLIIILAVLAIAVGAYTVGSGMYFVSQNVSASPALYSQDTVTSIYEKSSPAVVEIDITQTATGFFGSSIMEGQGSGFLVDDQGHILTNNHVVTNASSVSVMLSNGNNIETKVVGTDSLNDLAIIKVDPSAVSSVSPLQFGDSSALKPGQMAIAIGNPYGLDNTITVGVVSGLNRSVSGSSLSGMIQTDAAINPGNSGGPLLDANGLVIGINTAIEASTTGARGIGFAVPSNVAENDLPDLISGKQVVRPWLGISGLALTQNLADTLGLSIQQGVYVLGVISGSPAEKAGLKAGNLDAQGNPTPGGDIITSINNQAVKNVQELSTYLNTRKVGDEVILKILRNGNELDLQVTLGVWPDKLDFNQTPNITPNPRLTPNTPGRGWHSNSNTP
jgi:serine protease Do